MSVPAEPRRVLVTGGAGFIGSHVAEGHLSRGDRVWVVDDLSTGRREQVPEGAEFVHTGLQGTTIRHLLREEGFHVVSHHAAQADVRHSVRNPQRDARTNLLGLLNLLEGCIETGVEQVVFISSGGVVYGEPDVVPTPESARKLPCSPYGVSKLAGEQYLHYYRAVHGLEYVALRYANVYGPRQDPQGEAGVVAIFAHRLLSGEKLVVFGDGEQTRDYLYVKDAVRANLTVTAPAFRAEGEGLDARAYNVGTGVGTSVNRLADLLEQVSGLHTGRTHRSRRAGELRRSTLDVTRLAAHGWAPRWSLERGLRRTFQHIANRTGSRNEASA